MLYGLTPIDSIQSFVGSKVRSRINEVREQRQNVWDLVQKHSQEYISALGLDPNEVKHLSGIQKSSMTNPVEGLSDYFLKIEVNGEEIVLSKQTVLEGVNHDNRQDVIFAYCTTNPSKNKSIGEGTAFLTAIDDELHRIVIDILKSPKPSYAIYWSLFSLNKA